MSKEFKLEYAANFDYEHYQKVLKESEEKFKLIWDNISGLECLGTSEGFYWFSPFEAVSAYRFLFEGDEKNSKLKGNIINLYRARLTLIVETDDKLLNNSYPKISQENMRELIQILPFTFTMTFEFELRKPYISHDDTELYVIDNPVRKEWVTKAPYIAPSQWKGTLHAAMVRLLADWWQSLPDKKGENERDQFVAWRLCLTRLFGNEKEVDVRAKNPEVYLDRLGDEELFKKYRAELKKMAWEGYRRGRLMFYPTFFKKLGLEVINPHDRETGAGTLPIYLETVPKGAKGTFSLLYVPFDRVGKEIGETARETAEDLCRVAEGVAYLFTEFGFGAKTSSSFGLAEEKIKEGVLGINLPADWPIDQCRFAEFKELREKGKKIKALMEEKSMEVEDNVS
jgi:CRISPR/Cas system CMR subunit Cmr6 (Cas7 group RAMP superfamily)